MEGCGLNCIKYLLFAFNLIFWLAGIGLMAVGIYVIVQTGISNITELLKISTVLVHGGAIALIVIGVITMIVGFLGCCGAIKENRCMLGTFFAILLLLLVIEIAIAIYAFVQRNQFYSVIGTAVDTASITNYQDYDDAGKKLIDFVQMNLRCCGMNDTANYNPTPTTCACAGALVSDTTVCDGTNYNRACKDLIIAFLQDKVLIVGGIGIGIGLTQIIGMIFACCLYQAKGKESDVV